MWDEGEVLAVGEEDKRREEIRRKERERLGVLKGRLLSSIERIESEERRK